MVRSVEAIVEGWISIMEGHSSKTRGLGQDTLETEMWICISGPEITHCDSVLIEALKVYWADCKVKDTMAGHYIR